MKSLSAHRCGFAARFIDGQEPILKLDLSTPASPPDVRRGSASPLEFGRFSVKHQHKEQDFC
jgi:hypothetical protein